MSENCPEFDYESLLEQFSHQDELLKHSEEERDRIDQLYEETLAKHKAMMNNLNVKKKINDDLKAQVKAELLKQTHLKNEYEDMQQRFYPVQQGTTLNFTTDDCQSLFLDNMNDLYKQYENLDSEFDDTILRQKIEEHEKNITILKEEEEHYKSILTRAKESDISADSNEDPYGTDILKPLGEAILIETVGKFGSLDYLNLKLANTLRNINALEKNIAELQQQMLD